MFSHCHNVLRIVFVFARILDEGHVSETEKTDYTFAMDYKFFSKVLGHAVIRS